MIGIEIARLLFKLGDLDVDRVPTQTDWREAPHLS
jgi:hypothetical protein